ncbi:MAG: hypothetical protein ACE5I7_17795 [Candidatus Binatia bacterium]
MTSPHTADYDPPQWPVPREQLWHELANKRYVKGVQEQGRFAFWWLRVREDYLARCDRAGFNRRGRCLFPEDHFFFMH